MPSKSNFTKTMRFDIQPRFRESTTAPSAGTQTAGATLAGHLEPPPIPNRADYHKLMESIYDAILITDANGHIVEYNGRALDFFRCTEDDLLNGFIMDLIRGAAKKDMVTIKNNLVTHPYLIIDAECVRSDKTGFPAEIAVNRLEIGDKGRFVFFVRDITIRKQQQAQLQDAVTRLEAHDRAKSLFVTTVSHELKTPLTSMIYAISNLLRGVAGELPGKAVRYLELLDGDCKRLQATVNDILDLRKIDTGTLTLAKARVPLSRMVRHSLQSFDVQIDKKFLKLELNLSGGNWFVDCDVQKMERVILNLLGNAVKFTPEGGTIEVSITDHPRSDQHVLLHVRDTGIGIPPESVDKVTDRFYMVGEQPSGSGLGLAISKEIVELHEGKLKVFSPPPRQDKGTQVTVSLPVAASPTLLVVDDEPGVARVMIQQLQRYGYKTLTAEDGAEALAMIEKERPDAVILDMVLPSMDGTAVILQMKSREALRRIPIVVVTGAHLTGAKADILNNYSIPALPKPWRESQLLECVEGAFLGAATLSR